MMNFQFGRIVRGLLMMGCLVPFLGHAEEEVEKKGAPQKRYLNFAEKAFWIYEVKVSTPVTHPLSHTSAKPVVVGDRLRYHFEEERRYMGYKAVSGMKEPAHVMYVYLQPEKLLREVQYLKIGPEGLFALGASKMNATGEPNHVLLSNPMPLIFEKAKPGVQWGWDAKVGPGLKTKVVFNFRVMGEEVIVTKAGEFKTRHVQVIENIEERQLGKRDYWFADGVGIVKEVDERYPAKGLMIRSETELRAYDLSPAEKEDEVKEVSKEEGLLKS